MTKACDTVAALVYRSVWTDPRRCRLTAQFFAVFSRRAFPQSCKAQQLGVALNFRGYRDFRHSCRFLPHSSTTTVYDADGCCRASDQILIHLFLVRSTITLRPDFAMSMNKLTKSQRLLIIISNSFSFFLAEIAGMARCYLAIPPFDFR